jgi:hypothetical protein
VSGEEMFLRNLENVNSGRYLGETGQHPEEFCAHRFTLQGNEGFFEGERLSEVLDKPMKEMSKDSDKHGTGLRISQQKNLEIIPPSSIEGADNMFSPSYA